jgi:hypothetical protein
MRALFAAWKKAKRRGVPLPKTEDPDYASIDLLMRHPLRSCRGYLIWLCQTLKRPDPVVPDAPDPQDVEARGAAYIDLLEKAWREHMAWMTDEVAGSNDVHTSRWGQPMTIEAMLEHAAVHPMRHRFQIEEWMAGTARTP